MQAERAGAALLAQLTAGGRLHAALAALRGAFFLRAPAMQGFAHALLARLERARLACGRAAPGSSAGLGSGSGSADTPSTGERERLWRSRAARGPSTGLGSGSGSAGPPAAAVLGVSAADVQELLDDALAEGCGDRRPGPADGSRLLAGDAEDICGLQLSVSGVPVVCWQCMPRPSQNPVVSVCLHLRLPRYSRAALKLRQVSCCLTCIATPMLEGS